MPALDVVRPMLLHNESLRSYYCVVKRSFVIKSSLPVPRDELSRALPKRFYFTFVNDCELSSGRSASSENEE
eukprot:scaffold584966_cov11-Prasinocladus_malaysianus.AAC.1